MTKQRSRFTWTEGWVHGAGDLATPNNAKRRTSNYEPQVKPLQCSVVIGDVDVIQSRRQRTLSLADKAFDENIRKICSRAEYRIFCRALGFKNSLYHKLSPVPEETEDEEAGEEIAVDCEVAAKPDGAAKRRVVESVDRLDQYQQDGDNAKSRLRLTPLVHLERKLRVMQLENPDMIDIDSFLQSDMSISDLSVISCLDSPLAGSDASEVRQQSSMTTLKEVETTPPGDLKKSQSAPVLGENGEAGLSDMRWGNYRTKRDIGTFIDEGPGASRQLDPKKMLEKTEDTGNAGEIVSFGENRQRNRSRLPRLVRRSLLYAVHECPRKDSSMISNSASVLRALRNPDLYIIERRYIIDLNGPYLRVIGYKAKECKRPDVDGLQSGV